jgi:peptidoglycan/LPS O-acetylase OafA/YrhL
MIQRAALSYVPELDGMRAVAVGTVVCAHYHLLPGAPGGFGVTLFFFLSGYLITTLFYAEYQARGRIDVGLFYVRRWLRLTPPLAILVILAVALHSITRGDVGGGAVPATTIAAALLYYTNYYDLGWGMDPAHVIPFGICWSLAVEEHFYLVWPWIMRKALPHPERLCGMILALCLSVLAWRAVARYGLGFSADHIEFATDCRLDSILYGALLRVGFETRWSGLLARLMRPKLVLASAIVAICMSFAVRDAWFRETLRYSVQGLALMPVFMAVLTGNPLGLARKVLSWRPMVVVGRLSYAIYLFHLFAHRVADASAIMWPAAAGLVLTGWIAGVIYVGVERPLAAVRHRLRRKKEDVLF